MVPAILRFQGNRLLPALESRPNAPALAVALPEAASTFGATSDGGTSVHAIRDETVEAMVPTERPIPSGSAVLATGRAPVTESLARRTIYFTFLPADARKPSEKPRPS
jgi:hypothetical protein